MSYPWKISEQAETFEVRRYPIKGVRAVRTLKDRSVIHKVQGYRVTFSEKAKSTAIMRTIGVYVYRMDVPGVVDDGRCFVISASHGTSIGHDNLLVCSSFNVAIKNAIAVVNKAGAERLHKIIADGVKKYGRLNAKQFPENTK